MYGTSSDMGAFFPQEKEMKQKLLNPSKERNGQHHEQNDSDENGVGS